MIYPIVSMPLYPIVKLWVRKVHGKGNIPKDKNFIFVSNHASFFDDIAIPYNFVIGVNRKFHIFVNRRFFNNFFLRKFLNYAECIEVEVYDAPEKRKLNEDAFSKAADYLKKGDLVGIFPEGHRSYDGELQKAKLGAAKLALMSKVAVLPIGIIGSDKILPKRAKFPRFVRCEIKIGKPLYFDEFYNKENDLNTLNKVTDKIMQEIACLTGKEYTHNKKN